MFILYQTPIATARKPYRIEPLFTHNNSDFGAISITKRSRAATISKVESQISDSCSHHTEWVLFVSVRKAILDSLNKTLIIMHLFVRTKKRKHVVRDFKDEHVNNFRSSLERIVWENRDKSDANSAYESFVNKFSEVYNKNIPTKTIQLKYRVQKSYRNPWLTKGLLKSIRTKAKLYKKFLENPSVAVEKTYKTF